MNTVNNTMTISSVSALDLLKSKKSSFVGLTTCTKQTIFNKGTGLNKMIDVLGIDPDKIVKHSKFVGFVGTSVSYEAMVRNRDVKVNNIAESEFNAMPLPFGERIDGVEVVKDGNSYVSVYFVANTKIESFYEVDGTVIDITDAKFDRYRKPAKVEGARQPVESPIVIRTYKLESLKELRISGESFKIV